MLADAAVTPGQTGALGRDLHLPATFRNELVNFIADQLPRWRDRKERKISLAETTLTSDLCAHLNSAARHSMGWDLLQFRTEVPDEKHAGRKIDLTPSTCAATVWIEGRRHTDFDSLFPIECKRLPTPKGKKRDEREYVISRYSSTGGLQRFKAGHHGATHTFGAMIGYIQEGTAAVWSQRVAGWIGELVGSIPSDWSVKDLLHLDRQVESLGLAVLRSWHTRENGLPVIELHHLWVEMDRLSAL
jgi:hypothetical protein